VRGSAKESQIVSTTQHGQDIMQLHFYACGSIKNNQSLNLFKISGIVN